MLADFGLAVRGQLEVSTVCGTAEYVPPEVLSQGSYHPMFVDRWALGIIIYEVMRYGGIEAGLYHHMSLHAGGVQSRVCSGGGVWGMLAAVLQR